jgi:hypothetical protein
VSATELHAVDGVIGSTVMEVTLGCTETATGPLVIPCEVTVMVAFPVIGLPRESFPLQTTNNESHTPPQTEPLGATVAILVLEELKVKVAVTAPFEEFSAETEMLVTSPAIMESVAGVTVTWATLLGFVVDF